MLTSQLTLFFFTSLSMQINAKDTLDKDYHYDYTNSQFIDY